MPQLEKLLSKEMTRKQFLLALLTVFGGLFGMSNVLALLTKSPAEQSHNPGYGKQHYGP